MFTCTFCDVKEKLPGDMRRHLNSASHKLNRMKIPGSFKKHRLMHKKVTDAIRYNLRMYLQNNANSNRVTPRTSTSSSNHLMPGTSTRSSNHLMPGTSTSSCQPLPQHDEIHIDPCAVYVKGFPPGVDVEPLKNYFGLYGFVLDVKIVKNKNYAIVRYRDPSEVKNLLQYPRYFMEHRLMVRPFRGNTSTHQQLSVAPALEGVSSFDDQVKILMSMMQPDFNSIAPKYNQLCADLHGILVTAFCRCRVHPFGSTVTGLSFKNSDVDVHVSGINDSSRKNKTDKLHLFKARNLLNTSNMFTNICAIINAKVPIIRCRHKYLNLNVDINFINMLGVFNSYLINYYLGLDWKLKPLMILIKYWANVFKLTGQSHLMKNYTLAVMLIFFLQQEPYNLPSVRTLQSNPKTCNMHAGWNVGFFQLLNFNLSHLKETSLLALFRGFLAYYSNFNYEALIICPYLGKTITKDSFKTDAPPEFDLYMKNLADDGPLQVDKPICVQDPFEHTRNITIVTKYVLDDFVDVCSCTLKNIENSHSEENLLHNLFKNEYYKLDKVPTFSAGFTLAMSKNLAFLQKHTVSDSNSTTNLWFQTIKSVTETVLRDIFRFTLTESEVEKNSSNDSDESISIAESFSFCCVSHYSLWEGRPKAKVIQKTTGHTILDQEKQISDGLVAKRNTISEKPLIEFQLLVEMKLDPHIATFTLENFRSYKKVFKTFSLFFVSKFPVWFHEHVNELNTAAASSSNDSVDSK